jgi:hypothetical protein
MEQSPSISRWATHIPPDFMEREGSLPCSQEPAPEPDESSQHLPTPFL